MRLLCCHHEPIPSSLTISTFAAAKIINAYPWLEESGVIDVLLPKKEQIHVGKW